MTTKSIDLMTRQQVRSLAGKLMEEWQNIDAVAEALGCHPSNVRRWHMEYRQNAMTEAHPVKEPGRPPKLTGNQQDIIRDIIFTKTPDDMNHDAALWSNTIIRDTIQDLFRTTLSLGTVNALTRKMGIVRRHLFRPDAAHDNIETAEWLRNRFPFIRKLAKDQKALIFFIHEEKIVLSGNNGSAPGGTSASNRTEDRDPVVRMLSAICPRNSQRFMVFAGPFAAQPFVAFLKGLMRDTDRHLFLVARPCFKPIALEADSFLNAATDRLSLFFLPKGVTANH